MNASLAAIHDPRRRLATGEAGRRLRRALGPEAGTAIVDGGAFAVGWSGEATASTSTPDAGAGPVVVIDGDLAIAPRDDPPGWLRSLRTAAGAFAVIVWAAGRGIVSRDHLGARPVFMATDGSIVCAASEVTLLLALLSRRPAPDEEMLALFLARRPAPEGRTLFSGIRALPPAHALILDGEGARLERYWRPRPRPGLEQVDAREAATLVRTGVLDAVRRHGGGRPDAGVLLSGGLDSSTVLACAAIAAQGADAPVAPSFTGVFPAMLELDEQALARPLAERYGSPWTSVAVPAGPIVPDAVSYLSRWEVPLEYPGGLFFRPVLEAAARHGVRVLLDGEGGDELFGCEPLLLADRVRSGDVRAALRLAGALPGTTGRLDARRARVLARRWVLPGLLSPRLTVPLRRAGPRGGAGAPGWLREGARATVSAALATDRCGWWSAGRPRWRAHLSWVLNDQLAAIGVHDHLRRITVPTGVADAHPLLDVRLIELALGLPPELAFDARLDRPVLRGAMAGLLPDEVRLRASKVYFDRLLVDALVRPDRNAINRMLGRGSLELGKLADTDRVRALWRAGPAGHPQGPSTWSAEVWRLFTAEAWLRREASGGDVAVADARPGASRGA